MPIKAVIFDMDGTLGDTIPAVVQAFQETFILYTQKSYSSADIQAMFGPNEEGVIQARVPAQFYQAALAHYLQRYTQLHSLTPEPFPGVIGLLGRLQKRGIHRAIVTGKGPLTAPATLQIMGLESYIEQLIPGEISGADKPAAFRRLLKLWKLKPEEAAYVGDMAYDMIAAQEAGLLPLGAAWAASATVKKEDGAAEIFTTVEALQQWIDAHC